MYESQNACSSSGRDENLYEFHNCQKKENRKNEVGVA